MHAATSVCGASIIAESVYGTQATAIRYGGEEFLVLAEDTDGFAAHRIAEELRGKILEAAIPHPENQPAGLVTASFGVAAGHTRSVTLEELVEVADEALYAAKRAGRNQTWPQFDSEPPADASKLAS